MTHDFLSRLRSQMQEQPQEDLRRLLTRAASQLEFARAFAAVTPERAADWSARIDAAEQRLEQFDPAHGPAGLADAVAAMEEQLSEIGQAAKQYRIHCIGHGHLDMNWMWSWPETVAATHDTFASVLRLMEQYPDFTFSQSQASVYALIERYYPALFAQIQARVREGRWEVTAAHWVEGDKNLASGESLCRHLLYTRRYFEEKFGLTPEDLPVDWEPDTFGHAATLPGILAQGAVKYYYCCRPGGGYDHPRVGAERPALFWWQGPDGARVLVNRETTWYNSTLSEEGNVALPLTAFVKETGLHDWLNVYGVGNHGGGPTRAHLDSYCEKQSWPIYPRLLFSTARRYFETIEQELAARPGDSLPTVRHELNFEFTGCYTSQALIKQANRFGENFLEEAETLALLASRLGGASVPTARLREAWINVLFNQFHDILPGSGVRETRDHALALFQEVGAITGAIKRTAGGTLTRRINTLSLLPDTWAGQEERLQVSQGTAGAAFEAGAGMDAGLTGISSASGAGSRFRAFVVYNPCAWPRSERVVVSLYDTGFEPTRIVARDETGRAWPALVLGTPAVRDAWGHSRLTVAFDAAEVPALGYRTYLLCEGEASAEPALTLTEPQDWFETAALRFCVDRDQGGLRELWDKRTGTQLVGPGSVPLGGLALVHERPRGMTAWTLGRETAPPAALHTADTQIAGILDGSHFYTVEGSPSAGFRIGWRLVVPGTASMVHLHLMISAETPRLDFEAEIDWRESGDPVRGIPGLVLRLPLTLTGLTSRYEVPFGSVERPPSGGEEVPALRYAHLSSEGGAGVTLLQDCKYGHSLHGSDQEGYELRLRLVRSSFDPDPTPEIAKHTVRYALFFHDTPADPATLARLGAAWNHPLLILPADLHGGEAPPLQSFVEVLTPNVVLTALKQAEDRSGIVLRLAELNGQAGDVLVKFDAALAAGLTSATLLDLMERPIEGTVVLDGGTVCAAIQAHGFLTIRLA